MAGKKQIQFAIGLAFIAILLQCIAYFAPLCQVAFFEGPLKLFTVRIHAMNAEMDVKGSDAGKAFCRVAGLNKDKKKRNVCAGGEESGNIAEMQMRFCSDMAINALPMACESFKWAHFLGMFLMVVMSLNIFVSGISIFLLYQYAESSAKKKYREVSMILTFCGAFAMVCILGIYYPQVVIPLSNMQMGPTLRLLGVSSNRGFGAGYAWPLLLMSILFQIACGILVAQGKTRAEKEQKEAREQLRFEAEMAECANLAGIGTELTPGGVHFTSSMTGSEIMYAGGFASSVGAPMPMQGHPGYQMQGHMPGSGYQMQGGSWAMPAYGSNPYEAQQGLHHQQAAGGMAPAW